MSMLEALKTRLTESRRAGNRTELGVLQVVLGEASMIEARTGKKASDEEIEKVIRKTILGNQETVGLMEQKNLASGENYEKLKAETIFLQGLLPATLSVAEIAAALDDVADAVKAAKNDGQATGVAMKHLKSMNLKALGEDVSTAVKRMRSSS